MADRITSADVGEPLTHFFHCWRFPDHHRCAVALIERQSAENDRLLVQADTAERDGPAPILGYRVDGKFWHPSDVTIVRNAGQVTDG